MLKERITHSLTAPYDYYLADLFREIEEAGCCAVPEPRRAKTWVASEGMNAGKAIRHVIGDDMPVDKKLTEDENKAIHALLPKAKNIHAITLNEFLLPYLHPPTHPPLFSSLPINVLKNIERAVKIYCQYIQPLYTADIQARAFALYAMAEEVAERHINRGRMREIALGKVKKQRPTRINLEEHLNAAVLECREYTNEEHHLDYFLLALMRLGMLKRDIDDSGMVTSHSYEIERSLNRGFSERREKQTGLAMYELREKEIDNEFRALGSEGGKAKNRRRYASPREYAKERFGVLIKLPPPDNRSGQMAITIAKELQEKCGSEIEGIPVDSETIRKYWIPEFKRKQKEKCPPTP